MSSFIWNRNIEEAYQNPYEYEGQEQFSREANTMLNKIYEELMNDKYIFHRDDTSIEKALFMLHVDSVESLKESLNLLKEKRHSVAARLLRDVFENVSLCNYFYFDISKDKSKNLKKWYEDGFVSNSICRKSIELRNGETVKEEWKKKYSYLSKITHRTYRTLACSYVLGRGETLRYEGRSSNGFLVPPNTISMYYALLSEMILFTLEEIKLHKLIELNLVDNIIESSYEDIEVNRRSSTCAYICINGSSHK